MYPTTGTWWQSYILPGLPAHLVQELNVGTVNEKSGGSSTSYLDWFE